MQSPIKRTVRAHAVPVHANVQTGHMCEEPALLLISYRTCTLYVADVTLTKDKLDLRQQTCEGGS